VAVTNPPLCPTCGTAHGGAVYCDGSSIDWAARKAKALAWGRAQQAEHDKAAAARATGKVYTAKVIAYEVGDEIPIR
jgi:hypothetical protein